MRCVKMRQKNVQYLGHAQPPKKTFQPQVDFQSKGLCPNGCHKLVKTVMEYKGMALQKKEQVPIMAEIM